MKCTVYRGISDEGRFLYVRSDLALGDLPQDMVTALGRLRESMTLDLSKVEHLVQVDVKKLTDILSREGYFLFIQDPEELEKKIQDSLAPGSSQDR